MLFSFALGYGYGIVAAYEIGPLLTTDAHGSGAFLRLGGEGDHRVSKAAQVGRAFANVPIGYRFRRESFQVEASLLPSLGGIAIPVEDDRLSGPLWLRQRLRVRLWHLQLELEHGRTDSYATAAHTRAGLCAAALRPPISSCAFLETFDRETAPDASFSEVGLSLGLGGFQTTTVESGYYDRIVRPRSVSR